MTSAPGEGVSDRGPVFLAGVDRSGIGLLGDILDLHSQISVSRRTRFWSLYYRRFGDLADPANALRAVDEMLRYRRIVDLHPDRERLLDALRSAGSEADDALLFSMVQEQHLEHTGKVRWADKTLNSERFADVILSAFPTARMIHVLRDPRDRYASQSLHRNASRGRVGAGVALWLWSDRRARRNLAAHPARYKVLHYEHLVSEPEAALDDVCRFIGEPFEAAMLQVTPLPGDPEPASPVSPADQAGPESGSVQASSVGRFRRDLEAGDLAFIQLVARRPMQRLGYQPVPVAMSGGRRLRYLVVEVPRNLAHMAAWWLNTLYRNQVGESPRDRRIVDAAWADGRDDT